MHIQFKYTEVFVGQVIFMLSDGSRMSQRNHGYQFYY